MMLLCLLSHMIQMTRLDLGVGLIGGDGCGNNINSLPLGGLCELEGIWLRVYFLNLIRGDPNIIVILVVGLGSQRHLGDPSMAKLF